MKVKRVFFTVYELAKRRYTCEGDVIGYESIGLYWIPCVWTQSDRQQHAEEIVGPCGTFYTPNIKYLAKFKQDDVTKGAHSYKEDNDR